MIIVVNYKNNLTLISTRKETRLIIIIKQIMAKIIIYHKGALREIYLKRKGYNWVSRENTDMEEFQHSQLPY